MGGGNAPFSLVPTILKTQKQDAEETACEESHVDCYPLNLSYLTSYKTESTARFSKLQLSSLTCSQTMSGIKLEIVVSCVTSLTEQHSRFSVFLIFFGVFLFF